MLFKNLVLTGFVFWLLSLFLGNRTALLQLRETDHLVPPGDTHPGNLYYDHEGRPGITQPCNPPD